MHDTIYDETDFEDLPQGEDMLKPIFKKGQLVYEIPDIQSVRDISIENMRRFDEKVLKKFRVSLDKKLILRKEQLEASLMVENLTSIT